MNTSRRFLAVLLAALMLLVCFVPAMAEEKPASWIADRTIVVQAYVDDIGYTLPTDLANTSVMKKITELTGITLDIRYTPGDSDITVMASQMASGNIPDVIVSYLNNSTRPEFPILLKAAKEGLFADVTEYMKNSNVYSKYMEDGYLPIDASSNISFRADLDGVYLMQLSIPAVDRSTEYIPTNEYCGGLYIQKSIADALGIDPTAIRTQDEFYDLLVKIKEGGFTDVNGNSVYPLGPKYWGGSVDALENVVPGFFFSPLGSDYSITAEGKIVHEVDTDFVFEKINYLRKLMAEGLMNPEFFTMDSTRAGEVSESLNSAIIGDVHNYMPIIYESETWIPLGPLNDRTGKNCNYTSGKGGYGAWAISSEAEKPEEIFAFFDWLASYEGQLITGYGVEGETYDMVDGFPVLNEEAQQRLADNDTDWMINTIGGDFGGRGFCFWSFMSTDNDAEVRYGESRPGVGTSETFGRSVELATNYPREKVLVPGLDISAYLTVEEMSEVKANMDLLNYKEMIVQAVFANSDDEVQGIVDSFRAQIKSAGIEQFYAYVENVYATNPGAVRVIAVD